MNNRNRPLHSMISFTLAAISLSVSAACATVTSAPVAISPSGASSPGSKTGRTEPAAQAEPELTARRPELPRQFDFQPRFAPCPGPQSR
jgi:hypothetical protein